MSEISDSDLSSFLAFTGSSDPTVARQYMEMSNGNLEMAVSLFMDTGSGSGGGLGGGVGGGGGGGGGGDVGGDFSAMAGPDGEVRAPDATRSMRLVGGNDSPAARGGPSFAPHGLGGGDNGNDPSAALIAAMGGPAAREMMRNMMADANGMGGGGGGGDLMMGGIGGGIMGSTWASAGGGGGDRRGAGSRRARSGSGSGSGGAAAGSGSSNARRSNQRRSNNNDSDNDDDVQVVDADGQAMDEDDDDDSNEYNYNDSDDDSHDLGGSTNVNSRTNAQPPSLATMFSEPTHLMHRAGGFMGAKNFAKDARRWLLVNIQSEDDFACHALNRDVWRDELVENLVREGFILWQAMSNSNEGQTYIQRYKVHGYPHLAILDPRTGSLIWRKEGWTQVNPLTAEQFVEIASDFCSRHSFDKMPTAARHAYTNGIPLGANAGGSSTTNTNNKRPIHELTEEEQLQAAIRASMAEDAAGGDDAEDNIDDVEILDGDDAKTDNATEDTAEDESKPSPFEKEILSMEVGDEPTSGTVARVQIRMPDGKRLVRKFGGESTVKLIYAFVAQNNEEAKGGRGFELKAKFPPQDLFASVDDSISGTGLNGEAINVIWK